MPVLLIISLIILGLALGLLTNYLADTLPEALRLSWPVCGACLAPYDLQGYLRLQPCSYCRRKRSCRAWLVQGIFPVVTLLFWLFPPQRVGTWGGLLLFTYFAIVFVIDLEHKIILGATSLVGVVVCGFLGWKMHGLMNTLWGGVGGFGIMWALYYLGVLFTSLLSRARGEQVDEVALGWGDVQLGLILGLLLGWPGITAGLFFGIFAGGLVSGLYVLARIFSKKYAAFTAIPYAPFLLVGAAILIFLLPVKN